MTPAAEDFPQMAAQVHWHDDAGLPGLPGECQRALAELDEHRARAAAVALPEVGTRFVWSDETGWGLNVYGPCEVNAVTPARVVPAAIGWHSTEGSCIAHSVDPAEFFAKHARALDGGPL